MLVIEVANFIRVCSFATKRFVVLWGLFFRGQVTFERHAKYKSRWTDTIKNQVRPTVFDVDPRIPSKSTDTTPVLKTAHHEVRGRGCKDTFPRRHQLYVPAALPSRGEPPFPGWAPQAVWTCSNLFSECVHCDFSCFIGLDVHLLYIQMYCTHHNI
jgi:hypothetical protein